MSRQLPRVAVLGGGMAGLAATWRLSEPGWRDRYASITVYQRGWRLGGKGASSRGAHGRIEEHGLHVWLGYYENAFRLMRECYAELDRSLTDPTSPVRAWQDAFIPAPTVGLEDRHGGGWHHWVGDFAPNDQLPGDPDAPGGVMTVAEFVRRGLRLLADFAESLRPGAPGSGRVVLSTDPRPPPGPHRDLLAGLGITAVAAALEAVTMAQGALASDLARPLAPLDRFLDGVRSSLAAGTDADPALRKASHLVSVVGATLRGIVADNLLGDPRGFRAIDGEDYRDWIRRHGAAPEAVASTLVSGLYDLVFAHQDGDPGRTSFGAGWGVFLSGKTFFDYKGAIFWKMTAGMGDIVFAPLYQALRRRGVEFKFFHRIDGLHLSADQSAVEAISVGIQAEPVDGPAGYEPLVRVRGLPCFPARPVTDGLDGAAGIGDHDLESHWCSWPDADRVVLRRGPDFDVAVLAIPLGMAPVVCQELIDHAARWRDMVTHVRTVATQSLQLWLREAEPDLGWPHPGVTLSGYVKPFDTWASMPQVIEAEDWPEDDRPRTIAYFCSTLAAPWPTGKGAAAYARRHHARVRKHVRQFVAQELGHLLPGAVDERGFRWDLLCGAPPDAGPDALDTQFWRANVDPSDRYVQSLAGTDRFRLRPDESGYTNLFLAGDWTDCGLNAGCIEAAVLSGLEAANAVLGRSRSHRIAGHYLL
jgi:uncharacterized protein with NAD-binding domain and iron-sulfur cluster